jgi:hypothetical protein
MDQFKNHPLYRRHNIDSAMGALWGFYKQNFLSLFLLSLAMSFIMQLLSMSIDYTPIQNTTDIQVMVEAMKSMIWPIAGIMLCSLFFNLIISYFILYNPLNPEINVFNSIFRSLKYFIPYLAIIFFLLVVGSLLIGIGLMAFIVGGIFSAIYVVTIYLFIAPVLLNEDADVSQTVKRTIKLTYKNFWSNFGWVSLLIVIILLISIVLSGIILLPFTGSFIKTLTSPEDASKIIEFSQNPVYIILSSLTGALTLPLMPIFSFILYFNSFATAEEEQSSRENDNNDGRVRVEDLYAKPYYEEDQPSQHDDNSDETVK